MSFVRSLPIRIFRLVVYPPSGALVGCFVGAMGGVFLLFWAWVLSHFMSLDLEKLATSFLQYGGVLGAVGGFLFGIWVSVFGEIE